MGILPGKTLNHLATGFTNDTDCSAVNPCHLCNPWSKLCCSGCCATVFEAHHHLRLHDAPILARGREACGEQHNLRGIFGFGMRFDTTQIAHLIRNTRFVDQHGGANFTSRRTRQTRAQIERNLRLRVDIQTGGGVVGGVAGLRQ